MDRRPLAVRKTKWANQTAKFLAKRSISPNQISLLSVLFSLLSLYFYSLGHLNGIFLFLAAFCIQMRLMCNLLDGMVAIEFNKKSIYGNLFNDVPDRFADVFIIMGAGIYSFTNEKSFMSGLDLAWVNAILAVITAYIRVLGASLATPMYFSGPMAKPQRMAILTFATLLSLIPGINFPFLFCALFLMVIGQCLTIYLRLKLISQDIKQRANQ